MSNQKQQQQKQQEPKIIAYSLGNNRTTRICKIQHFNISSVLDHKIFIVDVSGSMGTYAPKIINQYIPQTVNESTTLITFSDTITEQELTPREYTSVKFRQGGTSMNDIPKRIFNMISRNTKNNIATKIVMVSDGEVSDKDNAWNQSKILLERLNDAAMVEVQLIRLLTSSTADPDTRALLSIGMFCKHSDVKPYDMTLAALQTEFVPIIKEFLGSNKTVFKIEAPTQSIVRMPGDKPTNELYSSENEYFLLTDVTITELKCDNCMLPIENVEVKADDDLEEFLQMLDNRAKMDLIVHGKKQNSDFFSFIDNLVSYFDTLKKIEEKSEQTLPSHFSRIESMKKRMAQNKKTLLTELSAMKNLDAVKNLSSQQLANFLRGNVVENKALKGLAKRQSGEDIEEEVRKEFIAWLRVAKSETPHVDEQSSLTSSFYSLQTMSDVLTEFAKNVNVDLVNKMTLEDMMTLVGFIGLPFYAPQRTLADAWIFRMQKIMPSCPLLQSDFLASKIASKNSPSLRAPGTEQEISGVLPLSFSTDDRRMWAVYSKHFKTLNKVHACVAMMGLIAELPFADVALQMAAILCLADQDNISTFDKAVMHNLIQNVRFRAQATPSMISSVPDDVKEWNGRNDVTGCFKPLIKYFVNPQGHWLPHLVRTEMRFKVHSRSVMLNIAKSDQVRTLLSQAHYLNPTPLFEAEQELKFTEFEVNKFLSDVDQWILTTSRPFDNIAESLEQKGEPLSKLQLATMVIQSMLYDGAEMCAEPIPANDNEALEYLCAQRKKILEDDYKTKLNKKKTEEAEIKMKEAIRYLLGCEFKTFTSTLENYFASPYVYGFSMLWKDLCCENLSVVDRLQKLFFVITGRMADNVETGVWNTGSFLRFNLNDCKKLFVDNSELWTKIITLKKLHYVHRYRNKKNRHGWGNDCPSFWAQGFISHDDMCTQLGKEEWNNYVDQCNQHGVKKSYLVKL